MQEQKKISTRSYISAYGGLVTWSDVERTRIPNFSHSMTAIELHSNKRRDNCYLPSALELDLPAYSSPAPILWTVLTHLLLLHSPVLP